MGVKERLRRLDERVGVDRKYDHRKALWAVCVTASISAALLVGAIALFVIGEDHAANLVLVPGAVMAFNGLVQYLRWRAHRGQ